MKNILILYKTKYGSSKEYAFLLEKKLKENSTKSDNITTIEDSKKNTLHLENYDSIVLISSVRMFKFSLNDFIKKYFDKLQNKKIYILLVSMSDLSQSSKDYEAFYKSNFLEFDERNPSLDLKSKSYWAKGNLIFSKLNIFEKLIIKFVDKMASKHPPIDDSAKINSNEYNKQTITLLQDSYNVYEKYLNDLVKELEH